MDELTHLVLSSQQHPEDEELSRLVREKTMELFYRLPSDYHLISEEQCSAFLLYCASSIERYINGYKPDTNYPYYILCIVRRRVRGFCCRPHVGQYEQGTALYVASSTVSYAAPDDLEGRSRLYAKPQLPVIFQTLLSQGPGAARGRRPAVRMLIKSLEEPNIRRGLLLSCSVDPSYALGHYLSLVSSLLGCEREMLSDFFASLDQLLFAKRQCYTNQVDRIAFRFLQTCHYREELRQSGNAASRDKLEGLYRFNQQAWHKQLTTLKALDHIFLSRKQLSSLLRLSPGTVIGSINSWKAAMVHALDAQDAKEYLG